MKKVLIFLIFILQFSNSYTQQPQIRFKHLKVQDGLSQSWVKSICQDKHGFMWFGTNHGLNKYDGYNFTVYKHNPKDKTSLSNNSIESIYEDKNGNLWIAIVDEEGDITYYDVSKLDIKGKTLKHKFPKVKGIIFENRVLIFDKRLSEKLLDKEFFGKPFGDGLQLSMVESLYLIKEKYMKGKKGVFYL